MNPKKLSKKSLFYPPCLREYDIDIRYVGKYFMRDQKAVVVTGTRECTSYGRRVSRSLILNLVKNGYTIVTGFSYGIDNCVTEFALDYGGRVLGFSAYGLSTLLSGTVFGSRSAKRILSNNSGAVFSPLTNVYIATKESYTLRNYIMAGFGLATIIVEAGSASGTFHTVNASLDYGKSVLSIPGSVFSPKSVGTHQLIKDGAVPCTNINDVLQILSSTNS